MCDIINRKKKITFSEVYLRDIFLYKIKLLNSVIIKNAVDLCIQKPNI